MHQPSTIKIQEKTPRLDDISFDESSLAQKAEYQKSLVEWQQAMLHVQQAYYHQGHRALIIFQGWDASGKGGAIRRLTEKLDPRGFRVYPINAPHPDEQSRHYLYRFQTKLPKAGSLSIFDRSYYERVLVERVEGFASEQEWQRAYQEINEFERLLMDDDVRIIKIFLHISKDEQLNRFHERLHNPVKQWKLTEEDIRNRLKWDLYEQATNDMFKYTSTEAAPWNLIPANKKWYTRVEVIKTIYRALSQGISLQPPPLDDKLVEAAEKELGISVDWKAIKQNKIRKPKYN